MQVDRLILEVVELQAEGVAFRDVNQLSHITIGLRPMELIAPRFLDARYIAHDDVTPPLIRPARPSEPAAAASSRSISSMVASRSTRRASARSSSNLTSR